MSAKQNVPEAKSRELATVPDPPWRRRRASSRPFLTREAIVKAALLVLDREGLKGVSMRAVAEELGTKPASLYWHVESKEELLCLVFDEVLGELKWLFALKWGA